jgi:chromosome segregation ATPase
MSAKFAAKVKDYDGMIKISAAQQEVQGLCKFVETAIQKATTCDAELETVKSEKQSMTKDLTRAGEDMEQLRGQNKDITARLEWFQIEQLSIQNTTKGKSEQVQDQLTHLRDDNTSLSAKL